MSSKLVANRDFMLLWAGQGISLFGSLISKLALPFLVIYTLRATPLQVAWLRICELLPGIVVGLLAGAAADHWMRRRIMVVIDIVRTLLVALIPTLYATHHLTLWAIMVLATLLSASSMVFDSACDAYLPVVVPPSQWVEANAKISALSSIAEVTGFGLAGVLFDWFGAAFAFSIDAFTFACSAFSLWFIRHRETLATDATPMHPIKEIGTGIRAFRKRPILTHIVRIDAASHVFFGMSSAVYMLYVSRVLHVEPLIQGLLYAIGGLGSLWTAGITRALTDCLGFERVLQLGSLAAVIGTSLLPLAFGPLWLIMVFIVGQQLLGDGGDTLLGIGLSSLRQQHTPNQLLGRIRSAWLVLTATATLGGVLVGGVLADVIGLRGTLFVGVTIRLVVVAMTFRPRRLTYPESDQDSHASHF